MAVLDASKQRTIRNQFDAYVKKGLCGEASDHKAEPERFLAHEMLFQELPDGMIETLYKYNEYLCEQHHFKTAGQSIAIGNNVLSDAIEKPSTQKRDVFLMAYCLNLSDAEIARLLNIMASTVRYHRTSSLK